MKEEGRGHTNFKFDDDEEILFVNWSDNSMVILEINHQC